MLSLSEILEHLRFPNLILFLSFLLLVPTPAMPRPTALVASLKSNFVDRIPAPATLLSHPALRMMTYNLKFASEDGAHAWRYRRQLIRNVIREQMPDLIGTQEGIYAQLSDMARDLPEYGWIGQGREGGMQGEFAAIFYRKDRFEPLDHGYFWLSETPEIPGSRSWGAFVPRMATWVRFRDRQTGEEFFHYNTHFDHLSPFARAHSARLLNQRIQAQTPRLPVIVTGDFNTSQRGGVHATFVGGRGMRQPLYDSWENAAERDGLGISTFHGWSGPREGDRRIDWILTSADYTCARSSVITYQEKGEWPSDHFPVVSELHRRN